MKTLRWLADARTDFERFFDFVLEKSPSAAERVVDVIGDGVRRLEQYPESGRLMDDESNRRELFLPFGAGRYVLRYRLSETEIVVLRVWHSREERD